MEGCQGGAWPRVGTGSAKAQAVVQTGLLCRSYSLTGAMVLEVSVVGKGAVWDLRQASVREWQCRPLGFWSKVMAFAAEKYIHFEKQFLA